MFIVVDYCTLSIDFILLYTDKIHHLSLTMTFPCRGGRRSGRRRPLSWPGGRRSSRPRRTMSEPTTGLPCRASCPASPASTKTSTWTSRSSSRRRSRDSTISGCVSETITRRRKLLMFNASYFQCTLLC